MPAVVVALAASWAAEAYVSGLVLRGLIGNLGATLLQASLTFAMSNDLDALHGSAAKHDDT